MATVNAVVHYHRRADGTYNIGIRVFHKNDRKFIETSHYVSEKQIDSNFKIKDKHLLLILEKTLLDYRKKISELGPKLNMMTCENLRDYLRDKNIDFIDFCTNHIKALREDKRDGSANNHRSVRNSVIDYFGRNVVSLMEVEESLVKVFDLKISPYQIFDMRICIENPDQIKAAVSTMLMRQALRFY